MLASKRRTPRAAAGVLGSLTRTTIVATLGVALLSGSARSAIPAAFDDAWCDLGHDLSGTHGSPELLGEGHLVPGTPVTFTLSNVRAKTTAFAIVGFSAIYVSFEGGVFVPAPDLIYPIATGGTKGAPSTVVLSGVLPDGIPVGTDFYVQFWIPDPAGPEGFAASNAVRGTTRPLYDVISEELDSMLEVAAPPTASKQIYSVQDFSNRTYVRSPDCWAAQIDLTGLSPWNQTGGPTRAGTLISPRHVAFAKHYPLSTDPAKNQLDFVTDADVTVTRRVVSVAYPAGDIGIGLLDADVPPEIAYHAVLPRDWSDHLLDLYRLPMLHLDQEEKALVRDMRTLGPNCQHATPTDSLRKSFSETLISGDSGNPAFLLVGGEAILILTHYSSVHGPFYTYWFDEVNSAMASLGGGYQLTEYDLDAFLQN